MYARSHRRDFKTKKILIIKLAAVGDVLRTTTILFGLKRSYPRSLITWITEKQAEDLLNINNYIDRLLVYDFLTLERLKLEKFDILICLDKEKKATTLANQVRADKKFGFGLDPKTGNVIPFNRESRYALKLGLSDDLKFRKNKKSYPQIIFEMINLEYKNDEYILSISDNDIKYAQDLSDKMELEKNGLVIGVNTGAGSYFTNKAWTREGFIDLIRLIKANSSARILLLGGPKEYQRNTFIISQVKDKVYDAGCYHSLGQFAAIINTCSLIVTGDTLALHIAIALKKLVVSIFGPTCDQEIELYGRGVKIISPIDCRPCYKRHCEKEINCMNSIEAKDIFVGIRKVLLQNNLGFNLLFNKRESILS
ncbi:MAG: glycosyltransferase family 9 protein [Candidatus Omnitrophota bacterium]